ncbi:MAG: hypothetical protein U9P36_05870, partial [Thermodesulfobacteriota bacterium]|nr:hypothetical protein [Thermodesulfobacteriota bacterium]
PDSITISGARSLSGIATYAGTAVIHISSTTPVSVTVLTRRTQQQIIYWNDIDFIQGYSKRRRQKKIENYSSDDSFHEALSMLNISN